MKPKYGGEAAPGEHVIVELAESTAYRVSILIWSYYIKSVKRRTR